MSRLLRVLLACCVVVLLLPSAASADQTDEANKLIVEAKAVLDDVNARSAQLTEMWNTVAQIDPTGKHATDALSVLADLEAAYDEIAKGQGSIAALFAELAALDVSEEYKTYAAQRQEVAALWIEFCDVEREMISTLETVYDPGQMSKMSRAEAEQLSQEAAALADRETEITAQVSEKEAAAVQYFLDNVAAEEAAGVDPATERVAWGVGIAAVVGGLIFNAVFAFLCGFLARRKGRSAAGWAILGFLIPVIALILVLVLKDKSPPAAAETQGTPPPPPPPPEAFAAPEAAEEWEPPSVSAASEPPSVSVAADQLSEPEAPGPASTAEETPGGAGQAE